MKTRRIPTLKAAAATAGVAAGLLGMAATPASAGTGSISPNPVTVTAGQTTATVTVSYSGGEAGKSVWVSQCFKPETDPTFNWTMDCEPTSEQGASAATNPTGTGTFTFTVFRGDNPSGDAPWGCYAAGDTPADGYTKYTTCYARVAFQSRTNTASDITVPFTFQENSTPPVSEAPINVLLPVIGIAAAGGVFLVRRRLAGVTA